PTAPSGDGGDPDDGADDDADPGDTNDDGNDDRQRDTNDDRQVALGPMNVGSAGYVPSPVTRSSLALSAPGPGVSTGLASQHLPEVAPPATMAAPPVAVPQIAPPAFFIPPPEVAPALQPPPTLSSLLGVVEPPLATAPVLIASREGSPQIPSSLPAALWALLAAVIAWRLVRLTQPSH
ncbi:MAG: hypothetical protein M3524_00600, partial [Actinomycetota bacterium]|nr:hypothetical protein [Actinomycetota bacterium]